MADRGYTVLDFDNKNRWLAYLINKARTKHTRDYNYRRAAQLLAYYDFSTGPATAHSHLMAAFPPPEHLDTWEFDPREGYIDTRNDNEIVFFERHYSLMVERTQLSQSVARQLLQKNRNMLLTPRPNVQFKLHGREEEGICLGPQREMWDALHGVFAAQAGQAHAATTEEGASSSPLSAFEANPSGGRYLLPKIDIDQDDNTLSFYEGLGRLLGTAFVNGETIAFPLALAGWAYLLRKEPLEAGAEEETVEVELMEQWDQNLYKNWQDLVKMELQGSINEGLISFQVPVGEGRSEQVDLVPNGENVEVTDDNKEQFVYLATTSRLWGVRRQGLERLRQGLQYVLPGEWISILTPAELELCVRGTGTEPLNVDDWEANTTYGERYTADSDQIRWFWSFVRRLHENEQRLLLRFATGTSHPPAGGFAHLLGLGGQTLFRICRDREEDAATMRLPRAATCFNTLYLPPYKSSALLEEKVFVACRYGSQGFTTA